MEENTVKAVTNVVEIRPGTAVQTDREREFVEYLLQLLRQHREDGVEVDSLMLCFCGKKDYNDDGETKTDREWLGVSRFLADERCTASTLAYMAMFIHKYASDCVTPEE